MSTTIEQLLSDAEAALQQGDTNQGEALCQQVLEEDEKNSTALFLLGTLNFQRGNYRAALQQLGSAANEEPEAVDIAINLAGVLMQLGDRTQAIRVLQRATRYCKDDAVFCPRIAELFISLGEPGAAIQLLSRLNVLPPNDQIILARAHGRQSNWREAVSILERLNEAAPDNIVVADQLASAAAQLRDYPLAIKAFERYLRMVKPSARDYLRFADLLLIAQKTDRCAKALDQAERAGESGAELHVLRARLARLAGDYDAALESAESAIAVMPLNGQAWAVRAELAAEEMLVDQADELSHLLNEADDSSVTPFHLAQLNYALAQLHERAGNLRDASAAWTTANSLQQKELEQRGVTYSPSYTEQMVDYIKQEFPPELFDQADATITNEKVEIQPIFIVGLPRSGTTLVERILGQHSQVTTGGEQEAMEYLATDFRQRVAAGKLPNPTSISAEQWSELRHGYLQRLPEINTAIFTDKMPHNFRHVGLILKLFPEARVIQMHRNLKDVCLSIYSHSFPLGHNYATQLQNIAHFYQQGERLMQHWSSLKSPRVMDLDYEKLVTEPEHYARQLVEFCGFPWDESFLQFHESRASSFTFSELQVRQPIASKRIERWRAFADHLPELQSLEA